MKNENEELAQALDICLDQVLRDGSSIELCLQRYPEHAAELEPLLKLALETRRVLEFTPGAAAKAKARMTLQQAIRRRQVRRRRSTPWGILGGFSRQIAGPYRWAMGTAAAILVVVMGGTGIVTASSNSLPDEPLYPVKRVVERVKLSITFADHAKAQQHAVLAARRSEEMAVMAEKGDTKRVENLAADVDGHLQKVQRRALPGVSFKALPEQDGASNELLRRLEQLEPGSVDKRRLRTLHIQLRKDFRHREALLQQAIQHAPQPAKAELRKARAATRQQYRLLIQAIERLAEIDQAPEQPMNQTIKEI